MAIYDYSSGGFPTSPVTDDTLAMKGTTYKYNGSAWEVQTGGTTSFTYTATSGQTAFTGADTGSKTLAYTAASLHVFLNGILLDAADYTATDGTTVTLAVGATTGDELQVVAYGVLLGDVATSMNGLSDVDTATVAPTDGQVLTWDNTASKWEPATAGGGSWEVVSSQTVTTANVYAIEFTGIGTTYSKYVAMVDMNTGSDSVYKPMYFEVGDASSYIAGSTDYTRTRHYVDGAGSSSAYGGGTYQGQVMTISGSHAVCTLDITGLGTNNEFMSQGSAHSIRKASGSVYREINSSYAGNSTSKTLDRIKFYADWDGSLALGLGSTVTLYGIKTS
mgnify:CR=1 FL=1|jgi:hypothetical protein|tara:strand:- start:8792 stop:9793 length:1002 start_codon:yes stop_codon:yes gene_type:complete